MRNILLAVIAVIASAVLPAPPASATHAGGAQPRLKIVSFQPQTNGVDPSQLTVRARDADGVIWEVYVEWGDGGASWATTGCVQGHQPGTVARLIIPHTYLAPGRYRIRAEASSLQHCPFDGPGGTDSIHARRRGRSASRCRVQRTAERVVPLASPACADSGVARCRLLALGWRLVAVDRRVVPPAEGEQPAGRGDQAKARFINSLPWNWPGPACLWVADHQQSRQPHVGVLGHGPRRELGHDRRAGQQVAPAQTWTVVTQLAAAQWGLLTTAQVVRFGVSVLTMSRLAERGYLEREARGMYRLVGTLAHSSLKEG